MLPGFGVQFTNRLSGAFRLNSEPETEGEVRLEITGQLPNLLQAFLSAQVALEGTISLAGFAYQRPVRGEMAIAPLRGVQMQLHFEDNQGQPCVLQASKGVDIREALQGKAELQATLCRQGGEELGTVRLEVDLMQSFGQFWSSLRPRG